MLRTRLLASLFAATALVASGCGSSDKSSSQTGSSGSATQSASQQAVTAEGHTSKPTGTLTRAELIAQGDAICYRLNVRRASTRISRPSDYEHLVPALAAYEVQGATELSQLKPPPSMAQDWKHIVSGARTVAAITGRFHKPYELSDAQMHPYDVILGNGINEMVNAGKRAGFKECSQFK